MKFENKFYEEPIHAAVRKGFKSIVKLLVQLKNLDFNSKAI